MTVNSELQKKIEQLSHANNDMNNLLDGTGIGTVFLDRWSRIQRFTPPSRDRQPHPHRRGAPAQRHRPAPERQCRPGDGGGEAQRWDEAPQIHEQCADAGAGEHVVHIIVGARKLLDAAAARC